MVKSAFTNDNANLDGFYVLRGYDRDAGVMSSVMDLPKADAIALMEKIQGHRGTGDADANGKRQQEKYYNERKATDDWLRDNARAVMDRQNPVFFALTNDPDTIKKYMTAAGSDVLVVPLKDADLSHFSFTFDDSMGNFFARDGKSHFLSDAHPLHGTVMDAATMAKAIAQYGTQLPDDSPRTFEAQYWSDKPLKGEVVRAENRTAPKADEYNRDAAAVKATPSMKISIETGIKP